VQLDGSLSLDPAGGPLALLYKWTSTTTLNPVLGDVVNPTFVPTLPGIYTFQLVVTNPNVFLSSFPATVRVLVQSPTNQAPVAVAHRLSPTGEIVIGDDVVLDGTGSMDPEGLPVGYAWTQTAGPKVILGQAGAIRASFTPVAEALYTFQLVVNDGVNLSLPALVSLTVKKLPTDVTFGTSITYGAGILPSGHALLSTGTLTLNVTTTDLPDTWFWYLTQTGGPSATIDSPNGLGQILFPGAGSTYTFVPPAVGTYTFRLAATTNTFFTNTNPIRAYADISVVVDDDLIAPTNFVPTANAGSPQTVTAGSLVTLDAGGSSNVNGVGIGAGLRTYWVQREGPPVTLSSSSSANPTFTPIAPGQYTFELSVADATAQSTPSFVVVTVTAAPSTGVAAGGHGGGCGFLGLEGMLLLPLIWLVSLLRHGRRIRRQA